MHTYGPTDSLTNSHWLAWHEIRLVAYEFTFLLLHTHISSYIWRFMQYPRQLYCILTLKMYWSWVCTCVHLFWWADLSLKIWVVDICSPCVPESQYYYLNGPSYRAKCMLSFKLHESGNTYAIVTWPHNAMIEWTSWFKDITPPLSQVVSAVLLVLPPAWRAEE